LETIAGMGHDLPAGAWGGLLDLVGDHIASATARHIEPKEQQ
jgi:hypothetical protein